MTGGLWKTRCLGLTCDALEQAVGDVAVEPGEDAAAVFLDGSRRLLIGSSRERIA
jgi:hypothetical protein